MNFWRPEDQPRHEAFAKALEACLQAAHAGRWDDLRELLGAAGGQPQLPPQGIAEPADAGRESGEQMAALVAPPPPIEVSAADPKAIDGETSIDNQEEEPPPPPVLEESTQQGETTAQIAPPEEGSDVGRATELPEEAPPAQEEPEPQSVAEESEPVAEESEPVPEPIAEPVSSQAEAVSVSPPVARAPALPSDWLKKSATFALSRLPWQGGSVSQPSLSLASADSPAVESIAAKTRLEKKGMPAGAKSSVADVNGAAAAYLSSLPWSGSVPVEAFPQAEAEESEEILSFTLSSDARDDAHDWQEAQGHIDNPLLLGLASAARTSRDFSAGAEKEEAVATAGPARSFLSSLPWK